MLLKKYRGTKADINPIWKEGRFVSASNLTLKWLKNKGKIPKIVFITPKTVAKSTVKRNLLRRRGYSAINHLIHSLPPIIGAFMFSKDSLKAFGGKREEAMSNLEDEIKTIISKIH